MKRTSYVNVSQEIGMQFLQNPPKGNVIMLNLLKFKEIADYSEAKHLKPDSEISGREAYQLYMQHTTPFLEEAGSELIFMGSANTFLIGPQEEDWDLMLLVKHASVQKFMGFANNPEYLAIAGHRTAALDDSRLLPLEALKEII